MFVVLGGCCLVCYCWFGMGSSVCLGVLVDYVCRVFGRCLPGPLVGLFGLRFGDYFDLGVV